MRERQAVFVDSGAWIALALTRDPLHGQARELWEKMLEMGARLHTSIPVVLETFTFLERNTTRIRNIYGSVATTRAVYVNSDNKIGTLSSSRRYKEDIKPMDEASETVFALSPVTFRYKKDIDGSHALSFGLIAEDVAKIDPNLITRDEGGKPQTVRYDAVNAMLLNEFLKEHRKVEEQNYKLQEQEATIAQLKSGMRTLAATVKEHDSKIQKVSDQLEVKVAVKNSINRGLTLKIPQ